MYTFKKGPSATVFIVDGEQETGTLMDEASLRVAIENTRLQRDRFASEDQYRNALVMYESALKFLLEEQA